RKASIAGSSYIVQIGKVDDYWSIAIFRGNDLVSVKKVGTLDPNVLTSIISSSISLPLISPYSIVRSIANIINEAKVRKYPLTYTPTPEGEQPTAPTSAPAPVSTPTRPAPAREAASGKLSDFESLTGLKKMTVSEATREEEISEIEPTVESTEPQVEEETVEEEKAEISKSEDMLGEFAAETGTAFSSMFEKEEAPAKPITPKPGAKLIEIPELEPQEKWQKGISGLSFFLDVAISYIKSKHGKDVPKLWQYYLEVENRNWKAAKGKKFEEIIEMLVNIERAMGSEVEVQEFTESTFKAKVSKCLSKNYKEKYKSALPLPNEFPCILCKIRGEAISRNLGYHFNLIETPEGCQIEMGASPKKEKLVI
ncbi:MAG: hypothetical protein QW279_12860, partial [Candidatus Jordarchaeaceae archaeon]